MILQLLWKKRWSSASARRCGKFLNMFNACNLNDIGSIGSKYRWICPIFHGGNEVFEKIHLDFSNDNWRLNFPDAYVKIISRVDFYDHHTILIMLFGNVDRHKFKYFPFKVNG